LTLLKIVRFSKGKSIRLYALASFSFEIIMRLLSKGKLTRPTKSFLVYGHYSWIKNMIEAWYYILMITYNFIFIWPIFERY
jgi:hypothetical protein